MAKDRSDETTEALFERFVIPNYGRYPVAMERGEGTRLWDEMGKEYLDFGAGIAVCSLGHAHLSRLLKAYTPSPLSLTM